MESRKSIPLFSIVFLEAVGFFYIFLVKVQMFSLDKGSTEAVRTDVMGVRVSQALLNIVIVKLAYLFYYFLSILQQGQQPKEQGLPRR